MLPPPAFGVGRGVVTDRKQDIVRTGKAHGRRASGRSIESRARILDAAARLFAERGYGLTKMKDVADALGMHVTALYYHFESKEALAAEVLGRVQSAALPVEETARGDDHSSHRDRITAAIKTYLNGILRTDFYGRARQSIGQHLPQAAREQTREIAHRQGLLWKTMLQDARDAGEIRGDIDMTVARMMLLGAMNWSIEWFEDGRLSVDDYAETLTTLLFEGFGETGRKPAAPAPS